METNLQSHDEFIDTAERTKAWRRIVMAAISSTCVECGYDLRGSDLRFDCPECGLLIEVSEAKNTLPLLDPTWLSVMNAGVVARKWLIRLTAAAIAAFVVRWLWFDAVDQTIVALTISGLSVVAMLSVWFVTVPPRLQVFPPSIVNAARRARLCAWIVIFGSAAAAILWLDRGAVVSFWGLLFFASPIGLAGGVGVACFVYYFSHLSQTFHDDSTRSKGTSFAGWYYLGAVLAIAGGAAGWVIGFPSLSLSAPGGAIQLIAGALVLSLPRELCARFDTIRDESHRVWQNYYRDAAARRRGAAIGQGCQAASRDG